MRVKELIERLKEFPGDMPVTTLSEISPSDINNPASIEITVKTWEPHSESDWIDDRPSFDYVDLI